MVKRLIGRIVLVAIAVAFLACSAYADGASVPGDGLYTTGAISIIMPKLDTDLAGAACSTKYARWHDCTLSFDSATLSPDAGMEAQAFSFAFTGGTGRVTITCSGLAKDGDRTMATIVFSSSKYTWAEVGGVKYTDANVGGDSKFVIPVALNGPTEIQAETTAMGNPHVIQYVLYLYTNGTDAARAAGTGETASTVEPTAATPTAAEQASALPSAAPVIEGLTYESTLKLDYAKCFQVYFYKGGYAVIRVSDGRDYLVVPEGGSVPEGAKANCIVLQKPLNRVYLAATSAMCLFDALDDLDDIGFSGTKADDWSVERAAPAIKAGEMRYAGKYSAPDYELLLAEGCDLAIESTMILHAPEVQEKLEELGIPVWIDMSSYEPEPLGRTEWIKAYAVLMGRECAAEKAFAVQKGYVDDLRDLKNTNLTVAFFYVNSSGQIVTRSASDYFVRMIEQAGGRYVFADSGNAADASSSVNMDAESFYTAAKDADYIIYNASIDNPPASSEDLIRMNAMFADFKAVREGNVWCTTKSLYQASGAIGQIISDLHTMLTGKADGLAYLYKLK
jgi:iron complex transport system substrate-binding protein